MDTFDPSSPPAPRPKSRTKTCLVIALMVGAVGFLLCAGVCGGFFAIRVWRIKNIGPYEMAFKQVQQAPEVIERLGQPVEDATWVPVAQRNVRDNQGSATIDFKVRGPKGQAAVRTQARMIDGIWGLAELDVTFADGERLSLAPGKAGSGSERSLITSRAGSGRRRLSPRTVAV